MAFAWNPVALPGAAASLLAFAAAITVLATSGGRHKSMTLALLLANEGFLMSGTGWMYFMTDVRDVAGLQAIFVTAMIAGPFCYLFVVSTLDTPLARPFRTIGGRVAVVIVGLAAEAWWLAHPAAFIPGFERVWYAPWEADIGAEFQLFWTTSGIVSLYALLCALTAYLRSARGSSAGQRAKFFAMAFGTRDAALVAITFVLPVLVRVPPTNKWTDMLYIWGYPAAEVLFVALLGYGVLKAQLFDLDLRIKTGVGRGVLATIFLAVFFVVAQLIQSVATAEMGYLMGAVAAGLMLFALRPLERVATRVADAAMPRVTGSSEYVAFRKLQVYRAALEGALEDGAVTHRERAMLERLRAELDVGPEDARLLEEEVARRRQTTA